MKFRLPLIFALLLACTTLQAEDLFKDQKKKKEKPIARQDGLLQRVAKAIWPFGKKPADPNATPLPKGSQSGKEWKQLVPTIYIEPLPLKLADVRTMKVTLQLSNHGKKLAQLEFPTTQRIEVLIKDSTGSRIEQWSEDHAFQNEPTMVTINPSERLEYTANVATRDLKAGQVYTVEGFFPNYDQLRASKQITPQ